MARNTSSPGGILPYNERIPPRAGRTPYRPPEPDTNPGAHRAFDTEEPASVRERAGFPWHLLAIGAAIALILFFLVVNIVLPFVTHTSDQIHYGDGRISNFDFNVGHGKGVSHFIAQVYDGKIIIIELDAPGTGTVYSFDLGSDENGAVVSITPEDVNYDGKVDLVISVEGDMFSRILYNTGTGFTASPPK